MAGQHKLRMGMVGGGPGAFIRPVHRMAAELDGRVALSFESMESVNAESMG
jgi:hypothetical protein